MNEDDRRFAFACASAIFRAVTCSVVRIDGSSGFLCTSVSLDLRVVTPVGGIPAGIMIAYWVPV